MPTQTATKPLVEGFGWRLFVSLLPLFGTIIFRLMEISHKGPTPHDALAAIDIEFWNLSFDIVFTAMGVYFGSVLFVKEVEDKRTATKVGIVLFALFFLVVVINMILAHAMWPFTQQFWRMIIADVVALISLSFAVYVN